MNILILVCFGTRPEYLKVKPIIEQLGDKCKTFWTGQHKDIIYNLNVDYIGSIEKNGNRMDTIISGCMNNFPDGNFTAVMVQGDTASAFGCALASFHRKIPLLYLESGLRSYDLKHPYPEEGYRQMIVRISDINLAPTFISKNNLINEGIDNNKIHVVGNSILDNLKTISDIEYGNNVLVTLHRNENINIIDKWFKEIDIIAKTHQELNFILPIHPNPNIRKHKKLLTNVNVIEPLQYDEMMNVIKKCKFIITDSGGLQEEGSFLNKKVLVCRKTTERPEGIQSGHIQLVSSPSNLKDAVYKVNNNYKIKNPCPYGDGNTAIKVKRILKDIGCI